MEPLWIVLLGVAIVIGCVLVLKLHAFLSLTVAALVVGVLTPTTAIERHAVEKHAVIVKTINASIAAITVGATSEKGSKPTLAYLAASADEHLVLRVDPATGGLRPIGYVQRKVNLITAAEGPATEVTLKIVHQDAEIAAGDWVVHPRQWKAAIAVSRKTVGERVANGFGGTCGKIGLLIAMAAIIGKCLLDSGAADRIVRSMLRIVGERGAPAAFLSSGFLLGIPVFFDTVFYLMIPLGKAMRLRTGRNYLLYVLTIVAGATMAHSLVPPTPGPLFVAEQLGVDIGLMILAGCVVGVFTASVGYLFAMLANRLWELPLRESVELTTADLEKIAHRDESELPPFWLAVLPILLPLVLIGGNTVLRQIVPGAPAEVLRIAATLGNKNIALVISAAIALAMLVWQRRSSRRELAEGIQAALASGGVIILITAAGGAFGQIIQQTGIANLVRQFPQGSPLAVLVLAFGVTAAVRTAQGSATVAMITAVGILSGLSGAEQLGFHPVYLALAIGCGSKPIAWMNDSGFWVICRMSGMTEAEGLKYITPMSIIMGLVGLGVVVAGAVLFPMVEG